MLNLKVGRFTNSQLISEFDALYSKEETDSTNVS